MRLVLVPPVVTLLLLLPVDWNSDGWLDLLVGDRTAVNHPVAGVDVATWQRRRAEDDEKIVAISMEIQQFMPQYQAAADQGDEPPAKAVANVQRLSQRMQQIQTGRSEYQDSKSKGHVWLLI